MRRQRTLSVVVVIAIFAALLLPSLDAFAGGKRGGGDVSVRGYFRKDGTYVQPHTRSRPDGNPYNNYGFPGNYNPNKGEISGGDPDKYLERYYQKKGGFVLPKTGTDD